MALSAGWLLLHGAFAFGFGYALWMGVGGIGPWIGLVIALLIAGGCAWGSIKGFFAVRLFPYYEQPVGDVNTFLSGHALARNCLRLDRLAEARGLRTISAFGFNYALRGETIVWHEAAAGRLTITGLLAAVAATPDAVDDAVAVKAELEKVLHALEEAGRKQIRFAFLLSRLVRFAS